MSTPNLQPSFWQSRNVYTKLAAVSSDRAGMSTPNLQPSFPVLMYWWTPYVNKLWSFEKYNTCTCIFQRTQLSKLTECFLYFTYHMYIRSYTDKNTSFPIKLTTYPHHLSTVKRALPHPLSRVPLPSTRSPYISNLTPGVVWEYHALPHTPYHALSWFWLAADHWSSSKYVILIGCWLQANSIMQRSRQSWKILQL